MNNKVEIFNDILLVMNERLKVGLLEQHYLPWKIQYELSCLHCKATLGDLFGRVNAIG